MSEYRDLPSSRAIEIRDLAVMVAQDYFPRQRVEPIPILEDRGISYSFGGYRKAFDGLLECRNGRFHVYCNSERCGFLPSPRARFTLAHELGHHYIDEHRHALLSGRVQAHTSYCEFESNWRVEREADLFATCLLMPPHRFAESAKEVSYGIEGILTLKDEFGTSITSTGIRFTKEDVMPCAVIKWHSDEFGWRWVSQSMYEKGLGQTMDEIDEVPRDSATALALNGETPEDGRYHQRGGTAAFWFPNRRGGSNHILQEQAVSLGEFGALTLLYPDSM